jgi:hypothetical protein
VKFRKWSNWWKVISRALPLVSFIARQRDLRDFVGDQFSGSEQEILSDSLKYWEGRFHTITLEDRNLPVIAEKRLLKLKSAEAKAQLQEAFASTERGNIRAEMFDVLLTSQGDRQMFRRVYPFSPEHELIWRGSRRRVEVLFENIPRLCRNCSASCRPEMRVPWI